MLIPCPNQLRDGFQATSLDQDEVERILDACIKHSDHWSGFKVAAMVLLWTAMAMGSRGDDLMESTSTDSSCQEHASAHANLSHGTHTQLHVPMVFCIHVQPVVSHYLLGLKVNSFGWLRYSGFVRHREPHLHAAGALADLLVFTFNLTGLDILQKIQSQDTTW
ncbi:TPA: hypothetical protein ACH3X1_000803 [Trebouxia sp. C0004]